MPSGGQFSRAVDICWAIFEGLEIEVREPIAIEKGNPDLEKVAKRFALTVM